MNEVQREQWRHRLHRLRRIDSDWVFYTLAFVPFFIISFAVWICLDEAIFALRYHVVIQWSLFPYFRIFADLWHYIGIAFFIAGLIIMGITLTLHRGPPHEASIESDSIAWYQLIQNVRHWLSESRILVTIALLGLFFLVLGLATMRYAFISQIACSLSGPGIPCFTSILGIIIIESLFLHQLGDVFVALGLVLIFIVVIRERSED